MSSITNYDYAVIVSTFHCMTDRELQCSTCKVKYNRMPERQNKYQERKGCFGQMQNVVQQYRPKHAMKGRSKILYYKCPALFYNSHVADLINYSASWEKGIMPYEGSYMSQPAKFVELMELVNNLMSEHREEIAQKEANYGKQGRGRGRA